MPKFKINFIFLSLISVGTLTFFNSIGGQISTLAIWHHSTINLHFQGPGSKDTMFELISTLWQKKKLIYALIKNE